jgi:hypothetical protein
LIVASAGTVIQVSGDSGTTSQHLQVQAKHCPRVSPAVLVWMEQGD